MSSGQWLVNSASWFLEIRVRHEGRTHEHWCA